MALLCIEPTFDFEADHEVVKMSKASTRHKQLYIKRSDYTRIRSARDWTWGKGIEGATPHHALRAAARTCLAKGVVEAQEDMPSIVCMSKQGDKGTRRKPVIAHIIRGTKVAGSLSEVETTADEANESCSFSDSELSSSRDHPVCNPQVALPELALEQADWPALHVCAVQESPPVDRSRPSHLEIAHRFVGESLDEQAATEWLCKRKEIATAAKREASLWKTFFKKSRHRPNAARKAKSRKQVVVAQARAEKLEALPTIAIPACVEHPRIEADSDSVKLARAAARHRKLHIKRSEFTRPRSARDWTWGKNIEGARPHHAVRAALRTRLAKGAVESCGDMPSIVCMSKTGDKGTRRKPAIARMVLNGEAEQTDVVGKNSIDFCPVLGKTETGDSSHQQADESHDSLRVCDEVVSAPEFADAVFISTFESEQVQARSRCVIA
eukprot:TRINITY_DN190_c0_g1_i1.p1 TRINITY_DN190_c0_g1~~TRINITY_DN190_c0_g1_i1.p1  ORF type:complete len:440 (+),score=90.37 TRINITY_DN190_c0_g1_i1:82-1401(+)